MSTFRFPYLAWLTFITAAAIVPTCTLPATQTSATTAPATAPATEIQSIDQQLQLLQTELQKARKGMFNEEMDAQPFMFDNWEEYTDKINASEEDEKKVLQLKKKINDLNQRKQTLLKETPKI